MNFLSMFIVIPFISSDQVVFGVYSVCISTAIFLSYADMGFVSAANKYAGESYAQGDRDQEVKLFGFSSFVLFLFATLLMIVYLIFAYNPAILIRDINGHINLGIASRLLFIQALFSYNVILSRFVAGVFVIRVENYVIQRIHILSSVIKISSVFYFFSASKYDIIGYFLLINLIDSLRNMVGLYIIKNKYNYNISSFIKSIRFNRPLFTKMKPLAFASLFSTLIWVLFYELDFIAIGALLGAQSVAIYSVAFSLMRFFRSLSSILYTPFQARFNHFIGLKDYDGLKNMVMKVIQITMPIVVFPLISIIILSRKLILTWVGADYSQSVLVLMLLAANALFMFIVTPSANLMVALEKIKSMYKIGIMKTLIFWVGIIISLKYIGVYSFPVFKLIATVATLAMYMKLLVDFIDLRIIQIFEKTILKVILPIIIQVIILYSLVDLIPEFKNRLNLIWTIGAGGVSVIAGAVSLYLLSNDYKLIINNYLSKVLAR
jgi:O-antigen/teichoic acid export membrane protein